MKEKHELHLIQADYNKYPEVASLFHLIDIDLDGESEIIFNGYVGGGEIKSFYVYKKEEEIPFDQRDPVAVDELKWKDIESESPKPKPNSKITDLSFAITVVVVKVKYSAKIIF